MPVTPPPLQCRRDLTETLRSTTAAIRLVVLSLEIAPRHKLQLVDRMIWALTEEPWGKYTTPIRSVASLEVPTKGLRHEHVYTRKWLKEAMVNEPGRIDELVRLAVACVVTVAEGDLLTRTKGVEGWERYRVAGIALVTVDEAGRVTAFEPARAA